MLCFLRKNLIAVLIIAVATAFIVIGVFRGEASVVLRKAVNICLECIGLA